MVSARLAILLIIAIGVSACADPRPPTISKAVESPIELPPRIGLVNDFAGALDAASRQHLEPELTAFQKESGIDFIIVIVQSLDGHSLEDHSMEIARQWCLDCKRESRGQILLDIAMKDQEFRFSVSEPLWHDLPNEELEKLQNDLEASFSNDDYSQGLERVVSKLKEHFTRR